MGDPAVNWLHNPLNSCPEIYGTGQQTGLRAIVSSLENGIFLEVETSFSIIPRAERMSGEQHLSSGAPVLPSHRLVYKISDRKDIWRGTGDTEGKPASATVMLFS